MTGSPLPYGFIEAIRSSPDDDLPRLAAADWLDENGDPARAELIRVQCEIERLIGNTADAEAAFEAHMLRQAVDYNNPPATDDPPTLTLLRRERELVKAARAGWCSAADELMNENGFDFTFEIRRGFADTAALRTSEFLNRHADVLDACPALSKLTLYGPRGYGLSLAELPAFAGIRRLELAGWLSVADAEALGRSPHLADCESLTIWIGNGQQTDVVMALATGAALAGLRELELVQLHGGQAAGDSAEYLDRLADELGSIANRVLGRPVARVVRPFARRYPLHGDVGYGVYAGHLGDGQPVVLVDGPSPVLIHIGPDGRPVAETQPGWVRSTSENPPELNLDWDQATMAGFQPGAVFVQEFGSEAADLQVYCWGMYEDILTAPDAVRRPTDDSEEEICSSLHDWWHRDQFVILFGNDFWAGPDGQIHSS